MLDCIKKAIARGQLFLYDTAIFIAVNLFLYVIYKGAASLTAQGLWKQSILAFVAIFGCRYLGKVYRQIWRYGGIQCYIRMILVDAAAACIYLSAQKLFLSEQIALVSAVTMCSLNLLCSMSMRMCYRYAYKCGWQDNLQGKALRFLLRLFSFGRVSTEPDADSNKIKIAIIGAGSVGISLAEELNSNQSSSYLPRCFVDVSDSKIGRDIHGIPVLPENEATLRELKNHEIQEVVFALPQMDADHKKKLYDYYKSAGYRIKVYDYPTMQNAGSRRTLREFDIEELLFRQPVAVTDEKTSLYYRDKVILITGGGGSIGSELSRQIAGMQPKQLILLDIYENGVYSVQQELKMKYGSRLDLQVEITSITNRKGMALIFERYHPEILIHAAAHKHVPLMEHNCIEAVENNVFGTKTVLELCEEYGVKRFMMVSTDKAVNPTNVMGATKRMCEMMVQAYSTGGKMICSATRFGNVLGSAGSVIPLFKRQIANGGPITLTDKRIIRYFMTIPEASQLILQSGMIAKNGELFVLDMGQPVKILDLAKNMIELSGANGIEIIETGLRPGEKLYEELLVNSDTLQKTENNLIFIEKEQPVSMEEIEDKLVFLRKACASCDDDMVREAMRAAVPTFRRPEEVNALYA